jgi:inorganic pyrophosphatase
LAIGKGGQNVRLAAKLTGWRIDIQSVKGENIGSAESDPRLGDAELPTFPLAPGILVKVRPVAVMDMTDSGDSDYKIIAVPVDDKRWDDTQDLKDLNKHMLKEFTHFFETYKILKGKGDIVKINGTMGKKEAEAAVVKSVELYNAKFGK